MGSKNARSVPVLMYHHVTPSSGQITTSPENFDSQMAALAANGYTSLTADQFAGYLNGETVPEKSVLITFDDGYLDNYVYAHPILQKHGMHAVMFLVTNWAGQGDPRPVYGSGDPLPVCPSHHECNAIVAAGKANDIAVRWSEVRAMEAAGTFEVHCHTHTHTRWDLNCDRAGKCAGIANDLQLSRAALLRELNKDTPHLCWPQGYFDDDYIQAAEALGFSVFYTTDAYGFNVVGGDPKYVYRIAVRNKPGAWLMHRIGIAKNPYWGPLYNRWKKFRKQQRRARELRRANKA